MTEATIQGKLLYLCWENLQPFSSTGRVSCGQPGKAGSRSCYQLETATPCLAELVGQRETYESNGFYPIHLSGMEPHDPPWADHPCTDDGCRSASLGI